MGYRVFCDRCEKELEAKGTRAALLMGQEHMLDLCPSCAYLVQHEIMEYGAKPKPTGVKK